MRWLTTRFELDLSRPLLMAIVNLTPDSFSDGGRHAQTHQALDHAQQLLREGADILDIGGESTRPGAQALDAAQEWQRIEGFLQEALRWGVPLSVDTYHPETMQRALDLGVDIINDIWALRQPGALEAVAAHPRCGVCLMHMHRDPQTMQVAPMQGDVPQQVLDFLCERAQSLQAQGVQRGRIVLDYGIGFGKTLAQNFELLARQSLLLQAGYPLLAGWSRKSSIGAVLQRAGQAPVAARDRVTASVAAALLAADRGAQVLRVHDVAPTVDALRVWQQMRAPQTPAPSQASAGIV